MNIDYIRGSRVLVIALAAAAFGLLGGCMTLAGALLPVLLDELGISLMQAGSMLAFQPIGFIIAVTVARRLIERSGLAAIVSLGILTAALGFGAFASVSSWAGGAAAMLVAGLGVGLAEVAANAAVITVAYERSSNVLNFVHVFFGVGSFVTPVLATRALAAGASWRSTFLVVAGLTALVGLGWMLVRLAPVRISSDDRAAEQKRSARPIFLLAVMLGLYVGTEMGIGGWLTKYLVADRDASLTAAGAVLSAYWFGLAAGRLLLSVLPLRSSRLGEEGLLVLLSAVASVALFVAVTSSSFVVSAIGFAVTGLGFSGIFPGVVALGGRYQPHAVAAATSVVITGAGLGNIIIPWGMSAIAEYGGVTAGMYVYAVMSAALLVLAIMVRTRAPAAAASAGPANQLGRSCRTRSQRR